MSNNLSDAIEAVTTIDIVEEFGIPNRNRRGRTYLICPGHDDNHFGSCYVDKNDNGYYCYVCGEHVNKWEMVKRQLNGDASATAKWFFQMSGITPSTDFTEDPLKRAKKIIKKLEKYMNNSTVYSDTCSCDKIDSSYGRNINGEYLYSERVISNPLLDLYKRSKTLFQETTFCILDTKLSQLSKMKAKYEKNSTDWIIIADEMVQSKDFANGCEAVINDINNLMIEIQTV